jgi:hypothetical protein
MCIRNTSICTWELLGNLVRIRVTSVKWIGLGLDWPPT